jgi:ribosomal protein S1
MNLNTSSANKSSHASSMAELLQKQKTSFVSVKKGEIVKGKVTKISSSEILLDINAKTEAVVLEKDRKMMRQLVALLHVGSAVTASVLNPESELGFTVVSLRRFLEDTLWSTLENLQKAQEKVSVTIIEGTKGGFIVETATGITGFLPNSHITVVHNQQMMGKIIDVVIVELDRDNKKVVFSQKAVLGDENFKIAKEKIKIGDTITVSVAHVTSFGIFVSIPLDTDIFIDGFIHISEISWDKVDDLAAMFSEGQKIEATVIGFDNRAKRIDLSIKRLSADPFEEIVKAFPVDKKITATVTEVTDQGVQLDLGQIASVSVEGLIKKDKVPPGTTYASGQKVTATVSQIDAKKRKILLVPVLKEKPIGYR